MRNGERKAAIHRRVLARIAQQRGNDTAESRNKEDRAAAEACAGKPYSEFVCSADASIRKLWRHRESEDAQFMDDQSSRLAVMLDAAVKEGRRCKETGDVAHKWTVWSIEQGDDGELEAIEHSAHFVVSSLSKRARRASMSDRLMDLDTEALYDIYTSLAGIETLNLFKRPRPICRPL
jgi:hypothetical protein